MQRGINEEGIIATEREKERKGEMQIVV